MDNESKKRLQVFSDQFDALLQPGLFATAKNLRQFASTTADICIFGETASGIIKKMKAALDDPCEVLALEKYIKQTIKE